MQEGIGPQESADEAISGQAVTGWLRIRRPVLADRPCHHIGFLRTGRVPLRPRIGPVARVPAVSPIRKLDFDTPARPLTG